MPSNSMVHVNNNLVCAVDVETTGRSEDFHEIVLCVFLPLDNNLEPRKDLPPFDICLRPNHIERIDLEAMRINRQRLQHVLDTGIDQEKGAELFEHWFEALKLPLGKRIMPLGHNISMFDLPFIRNWLSPSRYEQYIHYCVRDSMQTATILNDISDIHVEQTPFNKLRLTYVAHQLGIEVFEQGVHDPLYDAFLSAQIYKRYLNHHLWRPI